MTTHVAEPLSGAAIAMPYRARTIDTLDGLQAFQAQWQALEDVADGRIAFQSAAWSLLAARHLSEGGEGGIHVVVVEDDLPGGRPAAILPLRVWRKGSRRVLTGLAEPYQQYTELMLRPDVDPARAWAAILDNLRGAGADYLHLGQVRGGGPLERGMNGSLATDGDGERAPVIALDDWPDFDAYLKSINAKTRKNMRNARNKLARKGALTHDVVSSGPALAEIITRTYEGRAAWLERIGLTSRAFEDANFPALLEALKAPEATGIPLLAMSLKLDGVPIAEQWGFVHKGCYYAFLSTWNADYEESSPGKLHLGDVVEACYARGLTGVDFIIPDVAYKRSWAEEVDDVRDYLLPFTPLGWLYTTGWLKLARPAVKRTVHAMPTKARKALMDVVLRR